MQKEDSTWFERNVKEKVRVWEYKNPMVARTFEYSILWSLISFFVGFVFLLFDLFHTDPVSARYMLSALVQSQAAIIAIVVSLTLIAVQLTASAYSPRVIRVFRENPDMWILLLLYGFSIFYGLLVLKMIPGAEDSSQIAMLNSSLEARITLVYALGISTFAILCLYVWNIMGLLTAENIINRLAKDITKDSLLNAKEDPIQPIMDIVHGSIMKYDIATTRVGLKVVTERVIEVIDQEGDITISERFYHHLVTTSVLAISRSDVISTMIVIENSENFGRLSAGKGLKVAARKMAKFLIDVGMIAIERNLEGAKRQAVGSLVLLTILSEETVKDEIQDNETKFKEQKSQSFQKFKQLYEQELEKLRAKLN